MKHDPARIGGTHLARLDRLPLAQGVVVRALRHWDGVGSDALDDVLPDALAGADGVAGRAALEDLLEILMRHGRRPLVRHAPGCPWVGADEAVLAHFVSVAATGEAEDAMLIASLLVEGPLLPCLLGAAQELGLRLRRACPVCDEAPRDAPPGPIFH